MEIITNYSVLSNMASKVEMKKKFLGILLHSTVKKLTEEKRNEAPMKLSKNGGIGMKNKKLRGNIHKILSELAPNNENSNLETNTIKQTHSAGSAGHSDYKETHNRSTNLPLAETIHRLQSGSETGTGICKVETIVGPPNCDSESPGACYGIWFNSGDPISHVRDYQRWKQGLKESALTYRAHEIMLAGLREEKEYNPSNSFRP